MLVSQFILGLMDDLRTAVEMHVLESVSQVAALADIQEHLSGRNKHQLRKFAAPTANNKPSFSNNDVWKAK
jgi:hypothetical protein